jgi:glucose/mannose-6-phosphate isomerase
MSISLDHINFKKQDPKNMIGHIEAFPQMCRDARRIADDFALPSYYIKAKKFVLLGMGGSGAAGDIMADLLLKSNIVAESIHDYSIPEWVDKETVVIASSFSGDTEECLDAFMEARERGAKLIAITTNGKLRVMAEKFNIPIILYSLVDYQPRSAIAYDLLFIMAIFEKLGHYSLTDKEFDASMEFVEKNLLKVKSSTHSVSNPAKILANKIFGRIPVIYSSGILQAAGQRFKTQINENAKMFAFHEVLPELNHNAILGYQFNKKGVFVISLESMFDHNRVTRRQNITAEILRRNRIEFERVKFVPNQGEVAEILSMICFGDFVSYYLAILNRVDPTEVETIQYLKEELNK